MPHPVKAVPVVFADSIIAVYTDPIGQEHVCIVHAKRAADTLWPVTFFTSSGPSVQSVMAQEGVAGEPGTWYDPNIPEEEDVPEDAEGEGDVDDGSAEDGD